MCESNALDVNFAALCQTETKAKFIFFFFVSFYCILLDSRSFSVEFFVVPAFVCYSVEHVAVVRGTTKKTLCCDLRLKILPFHSNVHSEWFVVVRSVRVHRVCTIINDETDFR